METAGMTTIVAARVQAKASRFGDASVICLATVVSVLSPMRNMSGAAWRAAGSIWHESRLGWSVAGGQLAGGRSARLSRFSRWISFGRVG